MPAKRDYNIKGTNDFLILAAIFFFLCIWAVKDAWFPSDKVLSKHPRQLDVTFGVAGTVQEVNVGQGDVVAENQVLAKLRSDRVLVEYEKARSSYSEAKQQHIALEKESKKLIASGASADKIADLQEQLNAAQQEMDEALDAVGELRQQLDSSTLKASSKGEILKIMIAPHTMVSAEQTALVIDPKDHFYLFNKSLTVLSFILFWVFLAVHILAR